MLDEAHANWVHAPVAVTKLGGCSHRGVVIVITLISLLAVSLLSSIYLHDRGFRTGKEPSIKTEFSLRLSRILVPCTSLSMMVEKPSSREGGGTVVRREHAIKRHTPKNAPRTNLIILLHNFQCFTPRWPSIREAHISQQLIQG